MSSPKPKIECRWCHKVVTIADYKASHGRYAPRCVAARSWQWMHENDYTWPGRDTALLTHAGVIKQVQTYYWWTEREKDKDGVPTLHYRDGLCMTPAAPRWAVRMARRLMEDQAMIQRLGCGRKQKRKGTRGRRQRVAEGLPAGHILVVPMELRIKIIRAAASSVMTQTMFDDDGMETAIILVRDLM